MTKLLGKQLLLISNPNLPPETLSSGPFPYYLVGETDSHLAKECQVLPGVLWDMFWSPCPLPSPALFPLTWGWSHGSGCQAVHVQSRHLLHLGCGKGCHGVQVSTLRHRCHDRRLLLHQLEQREQRKNITRPLAEQPVALAPGGHPVRGVYIASSGVSAHHPCGTPMPQAWSFFALQGLGAKGIFAAWSLYGPHPTMCSLVWRCPVAWTQPTSSLVFLWSERQRKIFIQTKQFIWAEQFHGLHCLYQNSGKAWRLLMGDLHM